MKKTTNPVKNTAENTTTENTAPLTVQESPAFPYTAKDVSKRGNSIRAELKRINGSFEHIAFDLHWFYVTKAYESVGYKNIYDMAQTEFGIARGTVSDFIHVVERFAKRDESGNILETIDEKWKNFKSSQLIAMHGRTDEELKEVSADMSVREIKKALKPKADEAAEDAPENDTAGTADSTEDAPKEAPLKVVERQVLVRFNNIDEYNRYLDGMNDYIEAALKKGKAVEVALV